MKQLVVMVGMHARGCVFMCVLYEADAVHYLFISPVCLAAIVCTSACLTIIMDMHYLRHTQTLMHIATQAIYLQYAYLWHCLLFLHSIENNCRNPVSHKHSLSYL